MSYADWAASRCRELAAKWEKDCLLVGVDRIDITEAIDDIRRLADELEAGPGAVNE